MVYFEVPLQSSPRELHGSRLGAWLGSLELLSAFPSATQTLEPAVKKLLACRNSRGLWDFGIQQSCPRFSDTYRRKNATAHDWTMRVACLISRLV
jgi:hypothetical protein